MIFIQGLRSFIFDFCLYVGSGLYLLLCLPILICAALKVGLKVLHGLMYFLLFSLRFALGLRYKVEGLEWRDSSQGRYMSL